MTDPPTLEGVQAFEQIPPVRGEIVLNMRRTGRPGEAPNQLLMRQHSQRTRQHVGSDADSPPQIGEPERSACQDVEDGKRPFVSNR